MQTGYAKIAFLCQYLSSSRAVNDSTVPDIIHTAAPGRGKLVTLIAGKRCRLLFTGDDDEWFMTRSLNVTRIQQTAFNCTQW